MKNEKEKSSNVYFIPINNECINHTNTSTTFINVPHESDSYTDKGCNSFSIVSKRILSDKVDAIVIA